VVNRQEKPLELLSASYFNDEPTLQYGRKVWLPPRSKLQSWHPVKLPAIRKEDGKTIQFQSLVMDAEGADEVLIRTDSGRMQHDGFLFLSHEMITGVIDDLEGEYTQQTNETLELITNCRLKQSLSRNISTLTDTLFVPAQESLQPLDQLVICDGRSVKDAAGISSIRQWLNGGGHLWVLLDQVDPALLEMLLGDDFDCEVVDRVSLNTVRIQAGEASPRGSGSEAFFEQPVDLVRVIVSDVETAFTVNGWPAAFWKNCGKGRLLVTTLGPRGWQERRPKAPPVIQRSRRPGRRPDVPGSGPDVAPDGVAQALENLSTYIPNDPMSYLCLEFWAPRKPDPVAPADLEPIVQQYVGYVIPSRTLVVGLLVGFSGVLALAGLGLWRLGRMEWLGVIGPVLAIGVSLVLIALGRQQRHSIPPTTASVQFVDVVDGTDAVLAEGQLGIFTPEQGQSTLGGHAGGWVMPDMKGLEGTTRRMLWTDLDRWEWKHLPAMSGSRNASFVTSIAMSQRITAQATFGPEGLTGQLQTADGQQVEDVLIATNTGRIGVDLSENGHFTARDRSVFSREQFLSANLLTDEQNRRRQILQTLLTNPNRKDFPVRPMLYFWTKPLDLGFEFAPETQQSGTALVAVPLELRRPPVGTDVSIASPLLAFKAAVGPDGSPPTGLWDQLQRVWSEKSAPSSTWLRFQVPQVLLPIRPISGRIVVSVSGPIGKLEIAGVRQGRIVPLKTWIDPVGTVELHIADGETLTPDSSGGILLRVSGGDGSQTELPRPPGGEAARQSYWRIESLTADLKVQTTM
ncbi:MAG: hypothetical protein JWM11_7606, partial [Planctomycetaceae bacterium]|nr:hypothetical protein [Planctomycetaceae bacterium]